MLRDGQVKLAGIPNVQTINVPAQSSGKLSQSIDRKKKGPGMDQQTADGAGFPKKQTIDVAFKGRAHGAYQQAPYKLSADR
ncbi:MAG: hypothetical protein ACPIOQ_36035 [Promethearchaeia archaeon]